ncbi:MAG: hypothetical protein EXR99_01630 [Gemmataceae bacterium]|nr:hypothetical protein [Gemmataceae bacterium]
MNCQYCSKPATVHFTDIAGGKKKVTHLCQQCAEAKKTLKQSEWDFPSLLQGLISKHIGKEAEEISSMVCPDCGIRYMDFRAHGRLGCPNDYIHFKIGLKPLLEKIHRSVQHKGKAPAKAGKMSLSRQSEIIRIRRELQKAVSLEAYEEASRLRDLLKEKETADGN